MAQQPKKHESSAQRPRDAKASYIEVPILRCQVEPDNGQLRTGSVLASKKNKDAKYIAEVTKEFYAQLTKAVSMLEETLALPSPCPLAAVTCDLLEASFKEGEGKKLAKIVNDYNLFGRELALRVGVNLSRLGMSPDILKFAQTRQRFIKEFINTANLLMTASKGLAAEEKSSSRGSEQNVDPEMVMFLLAMGVKLHPKTDLSQLTSKTGVSLLMYAMDYVALHKDRKYILSHVFATIQGYDATRRKKYLNYKVPGSQITAFTLAENGRRVNKQASDSEGVNYYQDIVDWLLQQGANVKGEIGVAAPAETKVSIPDIDQEALKTIRDGYYKCLTAVVWHETEILKKTGCSREDILKRHEEIVETHIGADARGVFENEFDRSVVDFFSARHCLMKKLCYDLSKKCMALAESGGKYMRSRQEFVLRLAISELKKIHSGSLLLDNNRMSFPVFIGLFATAFLGEISGKTAKTAKSAVSVLGAELGKEQGGDDLAKTLANISCLSDAEIFKNDDSQKRSEEFNNTAMVVLPALMLRYDARKQSRSEGREPSVSSSSLSSVAEAQPALFSAASQRQRSLVSEKSNTDVERRQESKRSLINSQFHFVLPDPRLDLAASSKAYLASLKTILSGVDPHNLGSVVSAWESKASECVKHLENLVNNKKFKEATSLSQLFIETNINVLYELSQNGYSKEQLDPLTSVMMGKLSEANALMGKFGKAQGWLPDDALPKFPPLPFQ